MEIGYLHKNNKIEFIIKFLIFILPLTLVSGPFIPDAIISISSITFLTLLRKEKIIFLKKNNFIKFFLCFYIYIVINSLFSDQLWVSLKSSITYLRFILFVCLVYYCCKYYPKTKYIFTLGLLFSFCVLCIDANFQYITGKNFFGFEPQISPLRISGMFNEELILGSYLTRLFPLLFGLLFLFFNKKKNFTHYMLLFTFLVSFTIFISAERTSSVLHLMSLTLLLFFFNFPKRYKLIIFGSLLVSVFAIISLNPHVKHRVITETLHNSDRGKYVFSRVHTAHYLTAINIFLEKPVFGSGIKTFRYLCNEDKYKKDRFNNPFKFWQFSCSTHPHNIYIQILSETGIVGFIFLISFYIYLIISLFKNPSNNKDELYFYRSALICLIINFFPFAPSGNFFNNWVSMIYILPLGFMLANIKTKQQ